MIERDQPLESNSVIGLVIPDIKAWLISKALFKDEAAIEQHTSWLGHLRLPFAVQCEVPR